VKVLFDAYWWTSGPPSLRHVLREIVFAWHRSFPEDDLELVLRHAHRELADQLPQPSRVHTTRLWPQGLAAAVSVASRARTTGADLVITHNFAARTPGRVSAVYLHDVLFLTNPEWFTLPERAYFSLMRRWVRRADLVFTSSVSEASRIADNTPAARVRPVGLGLSTELIGEPGVLDEDPALLPRRFVLTVGRLNARKNLGGVIRAALATGQVSSAMPLVVVGEADGRRDHLDPAARAAIAAGSVLFVGFVSEERLRWYYRNAALFVFLSLGEGFGMPPVEAAYFATPTLVSDLPVFRENLGTTAEYVHPWDEPAIVAAITAGIARGRELAPELRPRGGLAARHDWRETVQSMRAAAVDRMEGARL